jgi:hypothetical protein
MTNQLKLELPGYEAEVEVLVEPLLQRLVQLLDELAGPAYEVIEQAGYIEFEANELLQEFAALKEK